MVNTKLGETGVKHINKNCIKCDVLLTKDNWYPSGKKQSKYICGACCRNFANRIANPKGNLRNLANPEGPKKSRESMTSRKSLKIR